MSAVYHNNFRNKFTLVELLVVIAIISILAGMLLPALENAIESSRTITCMNNHKQFVIAISLYADENADYFPHHYRSDDPSYNTNG
ncbi:MAG: type II secretion system protein, partial [Planctomycetota bacterium]